MEDLLFKLENLSKDEINLILISLSEQPYKVSFQLINKVQSQANEQLQEQQK